MPQTSQLSSKALTYVPLSDRNKGQLNKDAPTYVPSDAEEVNAKTKITAETVGEKALEGEGGRRRRRGRKSRKASRKSRRGRRSTRKY